MKRIRTCRLCLAVKCLSEFYLWKKGRLTACKDCIRKQNDKAKAKYRLTEKGKETLRKNSMTEKAKATRKKYSRSKRGIEVLLKSRNKWMENNPEKRKAHVIRRYMLDRVDICSKCGHRGRTEGHHADYDKPLEVIWLCRQCHVDVHKKHGRKNSETKTKKT